jgi:multidrug efflux system membrane fusion protein
MTRRRWILLLIGLSLLAIIVAVMRGRSRPQTPAQAGAGGDRVIPVSTGRVVAQDVPIILEGLGNVVPLQTVTLRGQVEGRLRTVSFKEGQHVHKGELIAQIDPRPFSIQLHQAEAALLRDSAQQRNAELNLQRYRTLREQNLVPQQQLDDQQMLVDQSLAAVKGDQAQLETAQLQLDYARIVSPLEGVTGIRQVDPGNLVHPTDANGIVVITQVDPIGVVFALPQDDLPKVGKQLASGPIKVDAVSRDGSTKLATGDLAVIDNQISASTGTVRLKATFANPDGSLWPNQFVKTRLLLTTQKGALVIPAVAVQRGPQGVFVYVANDDNTVAVRPVEVGSTQGDLAIIAKGLAAGDNVVTEGQNQLRAGSKVAPRPAASAATNRAGGSP